MCSRHLNTCVVTNSCLFKEKPIHPHDCHILMASWCSCSPEIERNPVTVHWRAEQECSRNDARLHPCIPKYSFTALTCFLMGSEWPVIARVRGDKIIGAVSELTFMQPGGTSCYALPWYWCFHLVACGFRLGSTARNEGCRTVWCEHSAGEVTFQFSGGVFNLPDERMPLCVLHCVYVGPDQL